MPDGQTYKRPTKRSRKADMSFAIDATLRRLFVGPEDLAPDAGVALRTLAQMPAGIAPRILLCLRRCLSELCAEGLYVLRDDRLEIAVVKKKFRFSTASPPSLEFMAHSVWAYFPIHRRRLIAKEFCPRPNTRVLLVLCEEDIQHQTIAKTVSELRDHFGHALVYLRQPRAQNECDAAMREWWKHVDPLFRARARASDAVEVRKMNAMLRSLRRPAVLKRARSSRSVGR